MAETWLHNNRRAIAIGMIVPAAALVAGVLVALGLGGLVSSTWLRGAGAALAALAAVGLALLAYEMRRPRLAFRPGRLLAYVRPGPPIEIPLELVEGFLLGQGPSFLPGHRHELAEAKTIVIKLADSAEEWSHVEADPRYAKWCDGYITLRGAWCEPLDVQVVNRFNRQLAEAARAEHDAGRTA